MDARPAKKTATSSISHNNERMVNLGVAMGIPKDVGGGKNGRQVAVSSATIQATGRPPVDNLI